MAMIADGRTDYATCIEEVFIVEMKVLALVKDHVSTYCIKIPYVSGDITLLLCDSFGIL